METKHFAWCPQCGDALEQVGSNNDYTCFGCGDAHFSLYPAQLKKQMIVQIENMKGVYSANDAITKAVEIIKTC